MLDFGAPPKDLSPSGAFEELRGAGVYEDLDSSLACLDTRLLSLPESGSEPNGLGETYGPGGDAFVEEWCKTHLLSSAEARVKLEQCGVERPFVDPAFANSPRVYRTCLQRAEAGGLIEYRLTPADEQVGVFAVPKKSRMQRLVLDAHRSN